ncbi:Type VI secretion lipoprotein, VC_A0113 family [Candidatus Methylobacter favarea]|uniref:Type VI secretion lipoprotein, VC_A0113 family n=1 Tax=Candidatus Methylobacter favarea TaxID=2707345 RepID=A0A8S0XR13_9GAMM|nr:type VI secretion system lipoprotein TssJ [Candidatus Methylobacter favarea]CAA9889687.1 Type VI secretion lipoprotein, VC_A0113 family [Candidatus Methylobacter favarea]
MPNITAILILLSMLLWSCSSDPEKPEPPPEPPTIVQAIIAVSDQVNPDVNDRPSPIVVYLYELKALGKFEDADFYKLYEDHESVLGSELVASEKFHLQPGDITLVDHPVSPETKYIAVSAAYRNLNEAIWKAAVPIPAKKTSELRIFVGKLSVGIRQK